MASVVAGAVLAIGASGCIVTPLPIQPVPEVAQVSVQPGAPKVSPPGGGVGLFVQYDTGGHWRLLTNCDTAISGASCAFDVTVSAVVGVKIDNVKGLSLGPTDSFVQFGDGSVNLVTNTTFGSEGLAFDANPGATIRLQVLVDGLPKPTLIHVVSQGGQFDGVPTNPIDLHPEAP
jgi:hypothetical protein